MRNQSGPQDVAVDDLGRAVPNPHGASTYLFHDRNSEAILNNPSHQLFLPGLGSGPPLSLSTLPDLTMLTYLSFPFIVLRRLPHVMPQAFTSLHEPAAFAMTHTRTPRTDHME